MSSTAKEKDEGESDNVRVAVRCRPLNPDEIAAGRRTVVKVDQLRGQVHLQFPNPRSSGERERVFTFDTVFGFSAKQVDLFNETARPIVDFVLEGYNGTIFAYGQTGTGKTYTMEGERKEPEKRGIIPNSFAHIFGHIAKCEGEVQFLVRVSYLEIYNEEVRDLLSKNPHARLEVRERADIGVYVKDLSSFVVKNADEMDKLMSIGNKSRAFAVTDMNDHSSRSHVIFTITVERSDLGADKQQHVRMGKLHLVDLAGSERQSKTGATGDRQKEAIKINLSLSTLGNVISALVDGKSTYIPYRNSNLTRLLQDSLGGNSKTVMIANIGPANYNCDESLNTLRYANRAKNIKNSAHINEDPKDAMLREFQKEIEELRKMLEEASGSEGSESGEEEGEGVQGSGRRKHRRKKRVRGDSAVSPRAAAAVKAEIDRARKELMAKKDLMEGEKDQAKKELEGREAELLKAQEQHRDMERKLQDLQSKVIVGGVNLLEKAEEQERLLEESAKELEKRKRKERRLHQKLEAKEAERVDMEERYANLQEEAAAKTKKLKEVWREFQQTKEELADLRAEFQQENEDMLEMVRGLSREVGLKSLAINHFIPREYLELLESHAVWHEDTGEWHIRGIAYAGNNMKKQPSPEPPDEISPMWDTASAYLTYHVGSHEVKTLATSHSSSSVSGRPRGARRTSGGGTSGAGTKSKRNSSDKALAQGSYPQSRGLISRQKHFA